MSEHEFKRIHQRKPYGADVVFAHNEKVHRGIVKNLSLGGAFIKTTNTAPFSEGDRVTVSIPYTSGKQSIKRQGLIKWLCHDGFAIEFI